MSDIKELKKKAESGDAQAQYDLGYEYYIDGVDDIADDEDNEELAVFWLQKAAEQGHTEAEYLYGHCLMCRTGVSFSNVEGSLSYFLSAAEKGHVKSMIILCELYSHRLICTHWDFDKAFYWIKKAAETGNAEAEYELGKIYAEGFSLDFKGKFKGTDVEQGLIWLKKSAEKNYLFAANKLGDLYYEGKVVEKNLKLALEWYLKGGNDRNSDSLLRIGEMYFSGEGVEQSYEKAFEYFKKSADGYNAGGKKRLADCYLYGFGIAVNHDKALELYKFAAKADTNDLYGAKSNLALMYAKDTPFKNEREAVIALHYCYNYTDNPEVFYEVAKRHLVGSDFRDEKHTYECYVFRKDFEDAAYYFKKAAEMGHLPSCLEYGKCLLSGIGVQKDIEKAKEWILKAAEGGVPEAQELLKSL